MVLLIDYDSLIYKAVYIVGQDTTYQDIKQLYYQGKSRKEVEQIMVDKCINALNNIGDKLMREIEDDPFMAENGLSIKWCEYFITPRNGFRKVISDEYKKKRHSQKRPIGKWVNRVRNYLVNSGLSEVKEGFEADDIIADRAREIGDHAEYIIASLDKDLKQIGGLFFDYYRDKETGKYRGFQFIDEQNANYFFWKQMLTGDAGDEVQGIKGIGEVRATKILEGGNWEDAVKEVYKEKYGNLWLLEYEINHALLSLGTVRNYETIDIEYCIENMV